MSSSESSYKFDERKALAQARAKLSALVGAPEAEQIYQDAVRHASHGSQVDGAAVVEEIEETYDHKVRRDSLA
jgi:hypothetical protein